MQRVRNRIAAGQTPTADDDDQDDASVHAACTFATCGGPSYCLHRYMPVVTADAVWTWHVYNVPCPLPPSQLAAHTDAARACLRLLLQQPGLTAYDLQRCGADAGRLAVLGVTIDQLVRGHGIMLHDLARALPLTWRTLVALDWHPGLLQDRWHYPVITLVQDVGMTGQLLLETFELGYADLHAWNVTAEELVALGFDGPLLRQLGLHREHLAAAVLEPAVAARGGAQWLCTALHITPELWQGMDATALAGPQHPDMQGAYASIALHMKRLAERAARIVI